MKSNFRHYNEELEEGGSGGVSYRTNMSMDADAGAGGEEGGGGAGGGGEAPAAAGNPYAAPNKSAARIMRFSEEEEAARRRYRSMLLRCTGKAVQVDIRLTLG